MPYCAYCGSWTEQVSQAPCASCGKPSNGAPVRLVPAGGTNPAMIVVIVAVVALFGVAIVGILAAIAIPNLLNAKGRAQQKRTMADMRTVATAAEAYATDNNRTYPRAQSMDELVPILTPLYLKTVPRLDGWGNELRYTCLNEECTSYGIMSAGADRVFEQTSPAEYNEKGTQNFDCDLVYVNGSFVQYPDGTSR